MVFIRDLLFVFWFFGPAGLSNLAAFLASKISFLKPLNQPVDFGLHFRKKRILGTHKTIRGFIAGILVAILIVYLEVFLYQNIRWVRTIIPIDYTHINPVLLGFLLGFGALAGDSVKSFFKRQKNVPPGKSWVPFDQVDYIAGGVLLSALYIQLNLWQYLLLFFMYLFLHPFNTILGYLFKLRKEPL